MSPATSPATSPAASPAASSAAAPQAAEAPPWVPKDDGQWATPEKNDAATRFSALNQINVRNVQNLQVAFTFSTGTLHGFEAPPIVVNNTMYILTPWPNKLYALDLTKPGAPLKWMFNPHPARSSQGEACCDTVNRGPFYWKGEIIYNTLDGNTLALDADTGKLKWKTKLAYINLGETITMAPMVVKGVVLVGNSGGELGVRGWLAGLNAKNGKLLWKAYATGPDKDVLIGPDFHPFYAFDRGKDLGVKTWPPGAWKTGGGTFWGWIAYDPDLNLIYYGTANAGPWDADQRPGDNKWTCTIFARDPKTGQAKWAVQLTPHDEYDYDAINEQILLNEPIDGKMRKVLVHPDRNGFMWVIDRTTGEVLQAHPYAFVNAIKGFDYKTGEIIKNPLKSTKLGIMVRDICPPASGAKDWMPSSFSPLTHLMYVPTENMCMDWENTQVNYIAGTPFVGANVIFKAGPGGYRGFLQAWDPVSGKTVWQDRENFPVWSGTVATAGNLVFYGTMDGWFKAVDATTGRLLWKFKTGSGIIGQPVAYRGPDGREYVAVMSGVGGWSGVIVPGHLNPADPTAALGFVGAMADLPKATAAGGELYVFTLPAHS